ncbi:hypothetical protein JOE21_003171 [Desmospora profundinema]|uniref:Uncharacterized protein n=1 Tax=Desmospora profundinema TaxID=1571184 RepID=A0ABU1IQT2_9BACL|nr:hypothetical protein [Desmospora profundinema]
MAGGEPLRFLQRNEDSHTDPGLVLRIVQTRPKNLRIPLSQKRGIPIYKRG